MNKKLIRKMLTASGGPIQKQKYLNEALLFAKDYRNSPGFKEKWNKVNDKITRRSGSKYDDSDGEGKIIWKLSNWNTSKKVTPWNNSSNAAYFPENGFFIGTNKEPASAMSNWKDELTHEVGHYFESNITPTYKDKSTGQTSPYGGYFSDIYPIFRNSKSYKETLDLLSNDEDILSYEKNPTFNYYFNYQGGYLDGISESLHDGTPSESYADLFLLKKKLLDSGVYDIRKANNPFTKLHLEQFKKKNKDKIRLFDNFSDEDIIWMMNNVAQNNMNNNNLNLYAKQGCKINNIIKLFKEGGLVRKMLTAAGGPLRLKFTPEQIAYFESQGRPLGVNNSKNYRKEGVLALLYQELEKARKELEIASRMEMKPVLVKKSSKLGEKDLYKLQVNTAAGIVSPVDPVAEFFMYSNPTLKGAEALFKTGLLGAARFAPRTQLGSYGRLYFVGNAFKNSFNGSVPTLTSLATSLLYLPAKLNESGLTSLKFFERPTLSNAQELAGATKWERNFKPEWHVANYPGYLLKGLMKGSLLEKQLSKNGTVSINLLNAYFNKASLIEREVANKVLAEKFSGLKIIDYNLFKKAVLDELITYTTKPLTKYSDYGMDRLGYHPKQRSEIHTDPRLERFTDEFGEGFRFREDGRLLGSIDSNEPWWFENYPKLKTFTFESPRISVGNNKHYDPTTLGHSRTYTTLDEPNILHVMESLSDWGQSHVKMMPSVLAHQIAIEKALKSGNTNAFHSFTNRFGSLLADKLTKYERMALENINKEIKSGLPSGFSTIDELYNKKYEILKKVGNRSNIGVLGLHLHDNYLLRQLQENLRYAAENGLTKMRYPTPETAAKIEGYSKTEKTPEFKEALAELERLQHLKTTNQMSRVERLLGIKLAIENNRLTSIPDEINIETGETKYYTPEEKARLIHDVENKLADILILLRDFMYSPLHQTILKKYSDFPKLFLKLFKDLKVGTATDTKGNTWYEVDVPKGYLSREWQFKQGGKMNIRKFLNAGKFYIPDEGYLQYQDFNNLSWANKMKRRLNIAKALYDNGSLAKAGYALFGGYDPENPRLSTGMPEYLPGRVNMSLYKNAKNILKGTQTDEGFVNFVENLSKGRIKPDFITKKGKVSPVNYNYVDLKSETIPKGFVQGNEVTIGQVRLPLEGLTVRNVTNPTEVNYVENAAEKAARADFLKTLPREKQFKEARQIAGSNKNTGSGIVEDWEYPTGILKKYKLGRYKETPVLEKTPSVTKLADNKPSTKTASLKSKDYYREKKEDLSNGVNKIRRRVHLNNKALTTGDMRSAGLGRPRTAAKNNDLRIELEKDPNSYWGRQYAKEKLRIAKGKVGAEKSEKEFLKRYWEYKQKGILNKEQNGGLLEFLKNGSGIHIKEKNKGSFTRWCGGNVTEECIRRGKASSNPKIRKKATFADNARHFKHKKGGKAFVNGVNVLDSNPDAYKYVKKKVKMRLLGGLIPWEITWINNNPSITDANRIFKHNSILQLTDEYNNLKLLELKEINEEALRYSSFLNEGINYLFKYLNKPNSNNSTNFNTDSWSKVKKDLAGTSYIKPDTNNKLFTSNTIGSNMNVTYDDMRNLIMR